MNKIETKNSKISNGHALPVDIVIKKILSSEADLGGLRQSFGGSDFLPLHTTTLYIYAIKKSLQKYSRLLEFQEYRHSSFLDPPAEPNQIQDCQISIIFIFIFL